MEACRLPEPGLGGIDSGAMAKLPGPVSGVNHLLGQDPGRENELDITSNNI
jgi:hypothetical protein